ncbi:MAG: TolB protein [Gaiellaceae bacterium]|nr:TolB protein [Gaiellaceae bacterium]
MIVTLGAFGADVSSSASRGRIAYVQQRAGHSWIVESGLDGANPTMLPSAHRHDASPVWSPDGSHIALQRSGIWFVVPAARAGRVQTAVRAGVTPNDGGIVWSPDGRLTAVAPGDCATISSQARVVIGDNGRLRSIRLRLRASDRPAQGSGAVVVVWGFSPDSRALLVSVELAGDSCRQFGLDDAAALYVVSLDGRRQQRFATGHSLWSATWSPDGRQIAYSSACVRVCSAISIRLADGVRHPLFTLAGPLNQDPAGLDVIWRLGRLIVSARLDRGQSIYTVEPGQPRRLLGQGELIQCECGGLVAFDTGAKLVLADPATTRTWTYRSHLGPPLAPGGEAVFLAPG